MIALVLLYALSLIWTTTQDHPLWMDTGWLRYMYYSFSMVAILGVGLCIVSLLTLHHPRSGKVAWLFPAIWAFIFSWLWYTFALGVAYNLTLLQELQFLGPRVIANYDAYMWWRFAALDGLNMAFASVVLVTPLIVWLYRKKQ